MVRFIFVTIVTVIVALFPLSGKSQETSVQNIAHVVKAGPIGVFKEPPSSDGSETAVVDCGGVRYRIQLYPDSIFFQVEKNAPDGKKTIDAVYDIGLDGKVDGGQGEGGTREFDSSPIRSTGDENKEYWQQYFDRTVRDILDCW